MKHTYEYQNKAFSFELMLVGKTYRATLGTQTVSAEFIRAEGGRLQMRIDGNPVSASVTMDGAKRWVTVNGQTLLLSKAVQARRNVVHVEHSAGQLLSPMPGQVRALQIAPDETVNQGQTLVIVEAMKMEIKIIAPFNGRVKAVLVQVGQTVEKEQLLVEIEA